MGRSQKHWNNTFRCTWCGALRPTVLRAPKKKKYIKLPDVCILCYRRDTRARTRRNYKPKPPRKRAPGYLHKCDNAYQLIAQKHPQAVRAPVEAFYPLYKEADRIAEKYRIVHIVAMGRRPDVCGLHVPYNLRIIMKVPRNLARPD